MITINGNNYNDVETKVDFGEYLVKQGDKNREGVAPFIQFKCDNILIGIETVYDKKWLDALKANETVDITSYIIDINYEGEKGWLTLKYGDYSCELTKNDNGLFTIAMSCECEELDQLYNININEIIDLN